MEKVLILIIFSKLWMYKCVENSGSGCVGKCTHVDKKWEKLFFKGYAQTMRSLIIGCKQVVGVSNEFNGMARLD